MDRPAREDVGPHGDFDAGGNCDLQCLSMSVGQTGDLSVGIGGNVGFHTQQFLDDEPGRHQDRTLRLHQFSRFFVEIAPVLDRSDARP